MKTGPGPGLRRERPGGRDLSELWNREYPFLVRPCWTSPFGYSHRCSDDFRCLTAGVRDKPWRGVRGSNPRSRGSSQYPLIHATSVRHCPLGQLLVGRTCCFEQRPPPGKGALYTELTPGLWARFASISCVTCPKASLSLEQYPRSPRNDGFRQNVPVLGDFSGETRVSIAT